MPDVTRIASGIFIGYSPCTMNIELRSLDAIRPYEKNPRKNAGAVAAVMESIKQFGVQQPIVVDSEGVVIAGHTRLMAARELGMKEFPVVVASGLSKAQVKAYRIADNKTNELAEWDTPALKLELIDLQGSDDSSLLQALGFDADELQRLLGEAPKDGSGDPDWIPEPPDDPTGGRGDVWVMGDHRLMCGDSSSEGDLDYLLDGAKIDLLNTDPPYNVKVEPRSNNAIAAGNSSFKSATVDAERKTRMHHQSFDVARQGEKKATTRKMRAKDRPLENDFVTDEAFDKMLLAWFGNASRVMRPGSSFYIWGGYANVANYPPAMSASGFKFAQAVIWHKQHPVLTRKDFMGDHEWCFYGWKEGAAHRWFGARNVPDVWRMQPLTAGEGAVAAHADLGFILDTAVGKFEVRPLQDGEQVKDGTRVISLIDAKKKPKHDDEGSAIDVAMYAGPSDVWSLKKVNPQSMCHLTEKPVSLAQRAISLSSKPGENVLDLFGGSGSTLMACERLGRKAFLMELDAAYCDVIKTRWEAFTKKKAVHIKAK